MTIQESVKQSVITAITKLGIYICSVGGWWTQSFLLRQVKKTSREEVNVFVLMKVKLEDSVVP